MSLCNLDDNLVGQLIKVEWGQCNKRTWDDGECGLGQGW